MKKTTKALVLEQKVNEVELSDQEEAAVLVLQSKYRNHVRAPDLKLEFDQRKRNLTVGHKEKEQTAATALAMYELGTVDTRFYEGVLEQVAALGTHGRSVSETSSNFVLSVVGSIKPQDEIEAMLAIQMGAIHQATMMMARRLNHVETLPQQDSAERALNKLARTFTSQVETLKKYRSKADQTVRVERVEVKEGGQAIVGNVQNGGAVGLQKVTTTSWTLRNVSGMRPDAQPQQSLPASDVARLQFKVGVSAACMAPEVGTLQGRAIRHGSTETDREWPKKCAKPSTT